MRRFLLFVLVSCTVHAWAQDEAKEWTLQECVKVALDNNLTVKRSNYGVETARINYAQSKMALLPSLNVGGSYGTNSGRSLNPVTNQFINRNLNSINVQGTSSVTLFNGLRLQNTIRQNARDYQASSKDLEKVKNDVTINVVTLYINVIFNQELYENARYQLNSSQQQLDRIARQVAAGALPKADQLNQEAQVATNEVNLINQENALNLSLLQLKQAMQLPASTPMRVAIPPLEPEDVILEETPELVYAAAEQTMPEIQSAKLRMESADAALRAARGGLYPRLSLNGSMQSNYSSASDAPITAPDGTFTVGSVPVGVVGGAGGQNVFLYQPNYTTVAEGYNETDQLKDNLFRTASIVLTIPLFNGWQNRAAVERSIIQREIANISSQETRNTLRQTIETAYNDALAAAKSYSASLKQVDAREEAYRMAKQRFEIGAVNYFEYQITENDLFRAKSDLARAKYNFIFRKKILDFYQGKPIDY